MERQEMVFLKAIRRMLGQSLKRIDLLLKQASAPRIARRGEIPFRVQKILYSIRKRGGKVTKEELANIASEAGMIVTAVGVLYQAGYIKQDLKNKGYVILGPKGKKTRVG